MPWWSEPEAVVEAPAALRAAAVEPVDSSRPSAEPRSRCFPVRSTPSSSVQEEARRQTEPHHPLRRFLLPAEVRAERRVPRSTDEAADLVEVAETSTALAVPATLPPHPRRKDRMEAMEISPAAERPHLPEVEVAAAMLPLVLMAWPERPAAMVEMVPKA